MSTLKFTLCFLTKDCIKRCKKINILNIFVNLESEIHLSLIKEFNFFIYIILAQLFN